MASKRRNRRRRRGRASFPLRLLCLAVVIAAFLGALTMFFRIDMIVVEGNERYTEEQIIEAAGVQKEQNLVLLNKYKVKQFSTRFRMWRPLSSTANTPTRSF